MSKRKILSLAMSLCVLAIVAVGGTIAYFTDADNAENVFTIGKLDIELNEEASIKNAAGETVEATANENGGYDYSSVKPGYELTKKPTITNTSDSMEAYVRVAVNVNNMVLINQAIDDVYENVTTYESEEAMAAAVQAKVDEVFEGWGLNYLRSGKTGRMWMTKPDFSAQGVEVYGVDLYMKRMQEGSGNIFANTSEKNLFQNDDDKKMSAKGVIYGEGYYHDKIGLEDRLYVYYMKMPAGKSVTLFEGLNVPDDFDNNRTVTKNGKDITINQMAMFDNLSIEIKVDAIQAEGFDGYEAAFTELEKNHPLTFVE